MNPKIVSPNMLKDALHNGSVQYTSNDNAFPDRNRSQLYALGIFHGVVSTLMAFQSNPNFEDALRLAVRHLPKDFDITTIHDSWLASFRKVKTEIEIEIGE